MNVNYFLNVKNSYRRNMRGITFPINQSKPSLTDTTNTVATSNVQKNETVNYEMSMEEYKEKVYDKISRIPIHPSQARTEIFVDISDSAFERMKNDPEYEKQMMANLEKEFGMPYYFSNPPAYTAISIGEKAEDYRSVSIGSSNKEKPVTRPKKGFWERRIERTIEIEKRVKEKKEKEELLEKLIEGEIAIAELLFKGV